MVEQVYNKQHRESGMGQTIRTLPGGVILVPSFTEEHRAYKTDPKTGFCSCKRYEVRGVCVKHTQVARAYSNIPKSILPSLRGIHAATIMDMARRTYAPLTARETPAEAYELFAEACSYTYAGELRGAALARLHKVQERTDIRAEREARKGKVA